MKTLKFRKPRKRLIRAVSAILAFVCALATGMPSHAEDPNTAYIYPRQGTVVLDTGAGRTNISAGSGTRSMRQGMYLVVPKGNSWSHLGFISNAPTEHEGFLVKAGPHDTDTKWWFPCAGAGGFTFAWSRNTTCYEVRLRGGSNQSSLLPNSTDYTVRAANSKNILKAQASSNEIIISPPSSEPRLIQTRNSGTNIEVDTIQGDILVKSDKYPQGRLIPEGKRYSYPQDTIEDLNRDEIAKSPEMQDFLNPANWLSPEVPQRVADGIADQLGQHRVALGLPTNNAEPIAARPEGGQTAPGTATSQLKEDLAKGSSYGDPHMITFDGFRYSFQTLGEFVLAKSTSGNFEVQTRQSQVPNSDFSLNTAAAMKVGNNRVAFYAKSFPDSDTSTPLRVNGKPTVVEGGSLALPGGGTISQQGDSNYLIEWSSGEQVGIRMLGDGFMNISPAAPSSSKGQYTGLLGNLDGDPSNDLRTRSGNVLPSQSTYGQIRDAVSSIVPIPGISAINRVETAVFDKLYKDFGDSWRISQNESLFDYASGQTTATFTDRNFPSVYKTLEMLSSGQIEAAEAACLQAGVEPELLEGCIFDVGFTGDTSFAQSAASALKLIDGFIPGGIPRPPVSIPGLPL